MKPGLLAALAAAAFGFAEAATAGTPGADTAIASRVSPGPILDSAKARAIDSLLRDRYLDMHCHTAGIGSGGSGCFTAQAFRDSYKYGIYLKAFGVTEKQLLDSGDAFVIKRLSQKLVGSSRVDLQACKLEYSIVSPK